MIDRREILAIAGNLGLRPNVVEKDYVLTWLLAGINAHEALAPAWVFKGGTCLKKCYFETYRFSEDLDFTVTDESHFDIDFLRQTFTEISEWIYDQTGIEILPGSLHFEVFENRRGRLAGQGRVAYRGPIAPTGGDLPRIKLDLTLDETLVLPPADRRIAHAYSDDPDDGMIARCYAYAEAFAEKVRALGERARPRDLYDVIHLHRNAELRPAPAIILDVLTQKCAFKDIPVPNLERLDPFRAELEGDWESMLRHQLPSLPPVGVFWDELPGVFAWLESGAQPAEPEALPLAAGDTLVRAPAGGLLLPNLASTAPIEIIRFAASNRLCVELDYTDERGRRATRVIEPYSLRRTSAGDIVLHAVRAEDGGARSYRVDRISAARTTSRTFVPRYAIELTPVGPMAIPMAERASREVSSSHMSFRRGRAAPRRSGPVHIYECPYCGKRFDRKTHDPTLRPHKDKNGWPCSGRRGTYVDTKR